LVLVLMKNLSDPPVCLLLFQPQDPFEALGAARASLEHVADHQQFVAGFNHVKGDAA